MTLLITHFTRLILYTNTTSRIMEYCLTETIRRLTFSAYFDETRYETCGNSGSLENSESSSFSQLFSPC